MSTLKLPISGFVLEQAHANIDTLWGPYNSLPLALEAIPVSKRKAGFKFGVTSGNTIIEYTFETDGATTATECVSKKSDYYSKNDIDGKVGNMQNLTTEAKSTLVGAINELKQGLDANVGIVSIEQTVVATESEGNNEVSVTLSNDTVVKFYIKNGADGNDGASAYEVYVANLQPGETQMTEKQWLESLKGPKGDQGPKGDTTILGDGQTYTLYNVPGGNTDGAMTQAAVTQALSEVRTGFDIAVEDFSLTGAGNTALREYGDHLYVAGDKIRIKVNGFSGQGSGLTLRVALVAHSGDTSVIETALEVNNAGNSFYDVTYTVVTGGYLYVYAKATNGTTFTVACNFTNKYKDVLINKSIEDSLTSDDATKVLSAKQGKILGESVDALNDSMGQLEGVKDMLYKKESVIELPSTFTKAQQIHGSVLLEAGTRLVVKANVTGASLASKATNSVFRITITDTPSSTTALETLVEHTGYATGAEVEISDSFTYKLTTSGYLYVYININNSSYSAADMSIEKELPMEDTLIDIINEQVEDLREIEEPVEDLVNMKEELIQTDSAMTIPSSLVVQAQAQRFFSDFFNAGTVLHISVNVHGLSNTNVNYLFFRIMDSQSQSGQMLSEIKSWGGVSSGSEVNVQETVTYKMSVGGYVYLYCDFNNTNYPPAEISVRYELPVDESVRSLAASNMEELVIRNSLDAQLGNDAVGSYTYKGLKMNFAEYGQPSYTFDVEKINIDGIGSYDGHGGIGNGAGQGFCCYGGIGFFFYDGGYCRVIDIENAQVLQIITLDGGANVGNNHCGQAVFGRDKFDANDVFPALYVSSYQEKKCYVFRITVNNGVYSINLQQSIYLSDGTNLLDAQAFFIDGEKLIIKMGATDTNAVPYKYWKVFDAPVLGTSDVTLLDSRKTDEFYIRSIKGLGDGASSYYDAGFARNGKVYVLAGKSWSASVLLVYDYLSKRILNEIPLIGSGGEPEQCYPYDDRTLLVNCNGGNYLNKFVF